MAFYIGFGQPNDRIVYYTGEYDFHGEELLGGVERAYPFKTMEEVCEYLMKNQFELRYIIYEISDAMIERIQKGYDDFWNGRFETDCANLYHKFNRVSYVINSEKEGES